MALIELKLNPTRRELRQFALIWFPFFFGLLGAADLYKTGSVSTAVAIWTAGVFISTLGLLFPPFMRLIFIGLLYAVYPIGWTVSHLLFAAAYYLVVTPIGLLMRVVRGDPLMRRFDRSAESYWTRRETTENVDRYFQQS